VNSLFNQIVSFAELEEFVNTKIKHFSTGMIQRLSFSIAVNARADIMFLDEVFAVGDAVFRKRAVEVLEKSWIEGRTVIIVSHSMDNIKKYCQRVLYLKKGTVAFLGDPETAIKMYLEDSKVDEKTDAMSL
jgi:ABC-type polysaccharide/polyol phosphate transport system ATPase subunit